MKKATSERRTAPRTPARYKVRYWNDDIEGTGLTTNVASTGLFVQTRRPPKKGLRLHLEIEVEGQSFHAEGVVARVQQVSAVVAPIVSPGMGVRFLPWVEVVELAEATLPEDATGLTLDLRDPTRLRDALENEIKGGGLLVPTTDPPEIGEQISLHVVLPASHGGASIEGRVVRHIDAPPGVGIEIADAGAVYAQLNAVLYAPVVETDSLLQLNSRVQLVVSIRGVPTVAECVVHSVTPAAGCAEPPPGGFRVVDAATKPAAAAPAATNNDDLISLDLSEPSSLIQAYDQQIRSGGLFVETDEVVELHANVVVYVTLPPPHGVLEVRGRVVHKSTNPVGFGLELLDPVVVDAQIGPILAMLNG